MAINNLTEFLTNIASTIRNVKGTVNTINPQDFASEIVSIKNIDRDDVVFYDYDGTILYQYSAVEFLSLTEMPPLPSHEGLVCDGWNIDYETASQFVSNYTKLEVGALYSSADNSTKFNINLKTHYDLNVTFHVNSSLTSGYFDCDFDVDWGDGNTETVTIYGQEVKDISHHYNELGVFTISITPASEKHYLSILTKQWHIFDDNISIIEDIILGDISIGLISEKNLKTIIYSKNTTGQLHLFRCPKIRTLIFPDNDYGVYVEDCASIEHIITTSRFFKLIDNRSLRKFIHCGEVISTSAASGTSLEEVICDQNYGESLQLYSTFSGSGIREFRIPEEVTILGEQCLSDTKLQEIYLGDNIVQLGVGAFKNCINLRSINIPEGITEIPDRIFDNCPMLNTEINEGVVSIGESAFAGCILSDVFIIPKSVTSIGAYAFLGSGVQYFKILGNLETIGKTAFGFPRFSSDEISTDLYGNEPIRVVDFTRSEIIPQIEGSVVPVSDSYESIVKIVVPELLWENWITSWDSDKYYICTNVVPNECVTLEISANDVQATETTTDIIVTATVNGYKVTDAEYVESVLYKTCVKSESFEENTSAESRNIEVSYSLLGKTVTTTIVQAGV